MNTTTSRILILIAAMLGVVASAQAWAQMADTGDSLQGVDNRVKQLEHKLNQLRRDVDTGSASSMGASSGSGFSESGGQIPQGFAARAEIKMGELEEELTRVTGKLEDIGFSVSRLATRLDKLVEDVDFRLSALERAGTSIPPTGPSTGPGTAGPSMTMPEPRQEPMAAAPSNSVPSVPGAGLPRSLGTISSSDLERGPAAGAASPTEPTVEQATLSAPPSPPATPSILPAGTPKEQYDFAYKLVRQGDYAQAERAFREFGQLNPSDPLAGNARYWLGETYYVRDDFVQAADVFIGVVTGYPDSPKRPHSMLKLGMSLLAMGQKPEGCATLSELLDNYTEGADATRTRAETERVRAGCS